jgi:Ca-activated chloride channel family protein
MPDSTRDAVLDTRSSGGRLVTTDGRALPLRGVSLAADAGGGLARAVLEQRFVNPHAEPLRVSYLVPLPADGALAGYAIRIGERRIVGTVERIKAARERFETALIEGRTAGLVDEERPSLFTLELGNVPPGAEVVAELTVDQRLAWLHEGAWEWRFSTVVAARYQGAEGRVSDAERVTVDVAEEPITARADVTLLLRDVLTEGRRPQSPSHDLSAAPGSTGWQVRIEDAALDRDLVVRWHTAAAAAAVTLDAARTAEGHARAGSAYGLLTLVPPAPEAGAPAVPRDVILLLDTSGSMQGEPIDQARILARALVQGLGEQDRLEMVAFASAPRAWRRRAAPMTEETRREALAWLETLVAGGGTEMRDAIFRALRPLRRDAQRQVVLVTDGLIGFENEIVAAVARDLPASSRLHVVGVGSSVNRGLTAPAARAGRGVEILVGLDEAVSPAVTRLLASTQAPVLTDVTLAGAALRAQAPRALPDVHAGAPLRAALELWPEGGEVLVQARTANGPWEHRVAVPALAPGQGRAAVVSLYGREAVEDLAVRRATGDKTVDKEIERLGLDFQIATARTSWVAIGEEPSVDPGKPFRRARMPHAMPHGLSVQGLGLRSQLSMRGAFGGGFTTWGGGALEARMSLRLPDVVRESMSARLDATAGLLPAQESMEPRVVMLPPPFRARLVLRAGRELTFEITFPLKDWRCDTVRLGWPDGVWLAAEVVPARSTADGLVPAEGIVRLTVRLAQEEDGPDTPPVEMHVISSKGRFRLPVSA